MRECDALADVQRQQEMEHYHVYERLQETIAIGKSILRHRRKIAKRPRRWDWWGAPPVPAKTWPPKEKDMHIVIVEYSHA